MNTAIILAAGKSSRMGGKVQKSFYEIGGEKLIIHLLNSVVECAFSNIFIVINEDYEDWQLKYIRDFLSKKVKSCFFIYQKRQLGTGHAVLECINSDEYKSVNHDDVIVFYADTPLVSIESIQSLRKKIKEEKVGIICGFDCNDKNQYGRIVLDIENKIEKIIEYKDYKNDEEVQKISLCNSGILAIKNNALNDLLPLVESKNEAKEYYLFDMMKYLKDGKRFSLFVMEKDEVVGINNFEELAQAEKIWQDRQRKFWMKNFVFLENPETVYFGFDVRIGNFTKISVNVEIKNGTEIGGNVEIHSNNVIGVNTKIGNNTKIKSFSYIENSIIGEDCEIGPFASITTNNEIGSKNIIGNFVEIKRSKLNKGNKIKHLAYCGNLDIGRNNNIGAGAITCNYDGEKKHTTKIGDNNFIGANSSLIAPRSIGNGNTIGAGSVVTKDVDDDNLVIERGEQKNIKRRKKD